MVEFVGEIGGKDLLKADVTIAAGSGDITETFPETIAEILNVVWKTKQQNSPAKTNQNVRMTPSKSGTDVSIDLEMMDPTATTPTWGDLATADNAQDFTIFAIVG